MLSPWEVVDGKKTKTHHVWERTKTNWSNGQTTYVGVTLMSDFDIANILAQQAGTSIGEWCRDQNITIIDGATIMTGTISADRIDVNDLISKGSIAVQSDIPTETEITTITNNTISTTNVVATNLKVDAANITGTLVIGQLPSTVASKDDVSTAKSEAISVASDDATSKANAAQTNAINTASSDATNKANAAKSGAISEIEGKGYQNASQVTQITKDTISTTNVVAENLVVKAANIDGKLTADKIDTTQIAIKSDIDNIEIGGRNLAHPDFINHTATVNTDERYSWNITKDSAYLGSYISESIFEVGETYTLSFYFQKTGGTLKNIGGHTGGYTFLSQYIDNNATSGYGTGISISDDELKHYVVLTFRANKNATDNNVYIQPNRGDNTSVTYKLWNIQVEKGNKPTAWAPAPEDLGGWYVDSSGVYMKDAAGNSLVGMHSGDESYASLVGKVVMDTKTIEDSFIPVLNNSSTYIIDCGGQATQITNFSYTLPNGMSRNYFYAKVQEGQIVISYFVYGSSGSVTYTVEYEYAGNEMTVYEDSPVRFYAGEAYFEKSERSQTLTFPTNNGGFWSQSFALSDRERLEQYSIESAECLTVTEPHSITETYKTTVTTGTTFYGTYYPIVEGNTFEIPLSHTPIEDSVTVSCPGYPFMKATYDGNGIVSLSGGLGTGKFGEFSGVTTDVSITYSYRYQETLDVDIAINDDASMVTFTLTPDNRNENYSIDVRYILSLRQNHSFQVLEDGSLYASAAHIRGHVEATSGSFSGHVEASSGNVGGLKIDNGVKGYSDEVETFSLTSQGLTITDSSARINVGNIEMLHDNKLDMTYFQANGPLCIRSASEEDVTSIELMSTGDDEDSITTPIKIYAHSFFRQWLSNDVLGMSVQLTSELALLYPITLTVYFVQSGGSKVHTVTLRLNRGETVGELVTIKDIDINAVQFALSSSDLGSAHSYQLDDLDEITHMLTTITQKHYDNHIRITGNLIPTVDATEDGYNGYNLGNDSKHWNTIFCRKSEIDLSDENKKNSIQPLSDIHTRIFDSLKPVSYKFKVNNNNRTHTGLIAQDVKAAVENAGLTTQDFAAYCEWENDDGTIGCGLRYSEFIALCVSEIQKLKKRVAELEEKLDTTK
jgi:hypothetical protein